MEPENYMKTIKASVSHNRSAEYVSPRAITTLNNGDYTNNLSTP